MFNSKGSSPGFKILPPEVNFELKFHIKICLFEAVQQHCKNTAAPLFHWLASWGAYYQQHSQKSWLSFANMEVLQPFKNSAVISCPTVLMHDGCDEGRRQHTPSNYAYEWPGEIYATQQSSPISYDMPPSRIDQRYSIETQYLKKATECPWVHPAAKLKTIRNEQHLVRDYIISHPTETWYKKEQKKMWRQNWMQKNSRKKMTAKITAVGKVAKKSDKWSQRTKRWLI